MVWLSSLERCSLMALISRYDRAVETYWLRVVTAQCGLTKRK